jgi:GDPmannose 4,6-dehydratase
MVDINPRYFRPAEVELLWGNPQKAEKVLGWKRKVDFKGLIHMMMDNDMMEIAGVSTKEYLDSKEQY